MDAEQLMVKIRGEQMTTAEFMNRRVTHVMETGSVDLDENTGTLECPECDRVMRARVADNGNWDLGNYEVIIKGDPFASHSYCSSGNCSVSSVTVSQKGC